jgi:glutamate carboxypeptidase
MGVFSAQSGYGAIYETARILNAFREQVIEPSLTFNPGLVFGGTNVSILLKNSLAIRSD